MSYNFLEFLYRIEEKRLVFGQKLEFFLVFLRDNFFKIFEDFFKKIAKSKNFLLISCSFVIFASFFVRFNRDFGFLSLKNIANFGFSNQFIAEILINAIGVFSLFICAWLMKFLPKKVSKKQELAISKIYRKLKSHKFYIWGQFSKKTKEVLQKKAFSDVLAVKIIIIAFAFSYFLRIFLLQYNEYFIKESLFLAVFFIYFLCNLAQSGIRKINYLQGFLAFLMVFLDVKFVVIIAIFEFLKFDQKEDKKLFLARNLLTILSLFFVDFSVMLKLNFDFAIFKFAIFPILLFLVVFKDEFRQINFKNELFAALIAIFFVSLFSDSNLFIKQSLIFSIFYPTFFLVFLVVLKDKILNLKQNWFLILVILLFFQFDPENSALLAFSLCCFWWILIIVKRKFNFNLIFLSFLSVFLSLNLKSADFSWLFCAVMTLLMFNFQWSFQRRGSVKKMSKPYLIAALFLLSYFLNIFLISVFNYGNFYAYKYKVPNDFSSEKLVVIEKNLKIGEKFVNFDFEPFENFDAKNYLKKKSGFEIADSVKLYQNIAKNNIKNEEFAKLNAEILKKENKIIFINKNYADEKACYVSLLEFYFKNEEFKREFLKNYEFLTQIADEIEIEELNDIQKHNLREIERVKRKIKIKELEIYVRKNS